MNAPGSPRNINDSKPTSNRRTSVIGRASAAFSGLAAAASALAACELIAGIVGPFPSLLLGIGDAVIDLIPGSTSREAISLFGTSDKTALIIGTVLIALGSGALLGLVARRWFIAAASGFVAFAVVGVIATAGRPDTSLIGAIVVGAIGAATGVVTLGWLLAMGRDASVTRDATGAPPGATRTNGFDRRTFVISAGGTLAVAALAGLGGWILNGRERIDEIRRRIRLPRPQRSARPIPAGADLDIGGLTPLFTANDDFYRVDTALRPPAVDPAHWHLDIRGHVDRPYSLTYDDLLDFEQVEEDVTLACVSNEVGGNLVGNARWQGVRLAELLERARVQPEGVQLLGHSVDGFTAGFPTAMALDNVNALVALGMNGQPLPIDHGFPARIIVPGLYGYVSATKWLTAIELTGWDAEGYWIPRGWARMGPIKTQSRIDVPAIGAQITSGRTVIAGVAWAPTRGISKVEVRIDDGAWQTATLADALGVDCWRQWHLVWDASPGSHTIAARATDGRGHTQTSEVAPPAPNGASGYPISSVTVTVGHAG